MPANAPYEGESPEEFQARLAEQEQQRKEYERRLAARIAKIRENPFVTAEEATKLAEEGLKKEHYAEREGEYYSQEEEMAANPRYPGAPEEELEPEPPMRRQIGPKVPPNYRPNTHPEVSLPPHLLRLIYSGQVDKPAKGKKRMWKIQGYRTHQ